MRPHIHFIVHFFARVFDVHLPREGFLQSLLHSFCLCATHLIESTYDQLWLHVHLLLEEVLFEVCVLLLLFEDKLV